MGRHTFILILVALGAAAAAVEGWRHARASAPVSGPIIVVSIETLRGDHLPVYGYTHVRTPAIDALAADGVVFQRAYSHAPQTLPAHTSARRLARSRYRMRSVRWCSDDACEAANW
jgi:hypothetical protein